MNTNVIAERLAEEAITQRAVNSAVVKVAQITGTKSAAAALPLLAGGGVGGILGYLSSRRQRRHDPELERQRRRKLIRNILLGVLGGAGAGALASTLPSAESIRPPTSVDIGGGMGTLPNILTTSGQALLGVGGPLAAAKGVEAVRGRRAFGKALRGTGTARAIAPTLQAEEALKALKMSPEQILRMTSPTTPLPPGTSGMGGVLVRPKPTLREFGKSLKTMRGPRAMGAAAKAHRRLAGIKPGLLSRALKGLAAYNAFRSGVGYLRRAEGL